MIIRKGIASVLVFLFINVSLLTFLLYGISNTFTKPEFYTEDLSPRIYDLLLDFTADSLVENSDVMSRFYSRSDLKREIMLVYPESMFEYTLKSTVEDFSSLADNLDRPLTLKLGTFRESLLTLAHNLSYGIYESIPKCAENEFPDIVDDGLVSCVPDDVEYNQFSAPFADEFEDAIYSLMPEQIQLDLNSPIGSGGFTLSSVLILMEKANFVLYVLLISILVLIALIIYKPFYSVIAYIGTAFFTGGLLGMLLGYFFLFLPDLFSNLGDSMGSGGAGEGLYLANAFGDILDIVLPILSDKVNRVAMVFLATGAILLIAKFFIKDHERGVV